MLYLIGMIIVSVIAAALIGFGVGWFARGWLPPSDGAD